MAEFGWGEEFFKINAELLELYSACADSADVVRAQNEWLEKVEKEAQERKRGDWGYNSMAGQAGAGGISLERNGQDWKNEQRQRRGLHASKGEGECVVGDSDDEKVDEGGRQEEHHHGLDQLAGGIESMMTHDVLTELPPSDEEYESYDSEEEPKLDKFGNFIIE